MPKDKGKSHNFSHKTKEHVRRPYSRHGNGSSNSYVDDGSGSTSKNEWEDTTCPVCMETPHNAVLLHCSSYEKGCRTYVCDTSYRHSNCLDQYCKAHLASHKVCVDGEDERSNNNGNEASSSFSSGNDNNVDPYGRENSMEQPPESFPTTLSRNGQDLSGLLCPLCRGRVQGWEVVKKARHYLDKKTRVCASESCSFVGSYVELRAHARREHPFARPSELDPNRVRRWTRLQRQRDIGDVWSVIRSAMPHSTILGDYAIDDDNVNNVEENYINSIGNGSSHDDEGHLLTVFLLFQVFGSTHSRPFLPLRGVFRRFRGSSRTRQGLWGEILQHSRDNENDIRDGHDPEEVTRMPSLTYRQQRHRHRSPPG